MDECVFEYAIIRVVPRVEREEFLNVGVLLFCPSRDFLEARIEVNEARLGVFAPFLDVAVVKDYLQAMILVCGGGEEAGPIGHLPQRGRFQWLAAPRSTMIQVSSVHCGLCRHPDEMLAHLFETMIRVP